MAEDPKNPAGGAGGGSAGGDPNTNPDSGKTSENGSEGTPNPKTVSWDNHQRVLKDMHKEKEARKALEVRLGDLESKQLQEKEDFKGLFEKEKKTRIETEQKLDKWQKWTVQTQRFNSVKAEAEKAGILPSALKDLELVDMTEVQVEATSGDRFLVSGEGDFVARLKNDRPHWFKKAGAPNVNGGGGGAKPASDKKLTTADVVEAERNMKKGKLSRKDYQETVDRYLKENP